LIKIFDDITEQGKVISITSGVTTFKI